jgi:hypothetical protein
MIMGATWRNGMAAIGPGTTFDMVISEEIISRNPSYHYLIVSRLVSQCYDLTVG